MNRRFVLALLAATALHIAALLGLARPWSGVSFKPPDPPVAIQAELLQPVAPKPLTQAAPAEPQPPSPSRSSTPATAPPTAQRAPAPSNRAQPQPAANAAAPAPRDAAQPSTPTTPSPAAKDEPATPLPATASAVASDHGAGRADSSGRTASQKADAGEGPGPAPPALELPSSHASHLHNPPPAYPPASERLCETGRVLLTVLIGADGRAKDVGVKTSSGFDRLDAAALQAVRNWRFVPGKRHGVPTAMWHDVPLRFERKSCD